MVNALSEVVDITLSCLQAGVEAVQADRLLADSEVASVLRDHAGDFENVYLVGAGKASLAMASTVDRLLTRSIGGGVIAIPHRYLGSLPDRYHIPSGLEIIEAGHPIPDSRGAEAAKKALSIAARCTGRDLLVVLISGGASALWSLYAGSIAEDDAAAFTQELLKGGISIHEINTLRKHISRIGGGRLAEASPAGVVLTIIISDVPGDDPSFIGSGPCSPDESTYATALNVITSHALEPATPPSILKHLRSGVRGRIPETPKPGAPALAHVRQRIIGTNRTAIEAVYRSALASGLQVVDVFENLTEDARSAGRTLAGRAKSLPPGSCMIWGGETTVRVTGSGVGGRNQELTLAAALELAGHDRPVVLASMGTDGIDGITNAAGAWTDTETVARGATAGTDAQLSLARNDSGTFFKKVGQSIRTGPTHTNVMDIGMAVGG